MLLGEGRGLQRLSGMAVRRGCSPAAWEQGLGLCNTDRLQGGGLAVMRGGRRGSCREAGGLVFRTTSCGGRPGTPVPGVSPGPWGPKRLQESSGEVHSCLDPLPHIHT